MRIIAILIFSCCVIVIKAQQDTISAKTLVEMQDSMTLAMQMQEGEVLYKPLPDFSLRTITRDTLTNTDLKGKCSIIILWDLYCQPCLDQMEVLNSIRSKYKERLNYVSITSHTRDEVIKFLAQDKLDFTHLVNGEKYLKDSLHFTTIPKILITDQNNIVREVFGVSQIRKCCLNNGIRSEQSFYEHLIEGVLSYQ